MKSPDIFIPKTRLELPLSADFETDMMLMAEHEMIRFGFEAVVVVRSRYPILPSWEEWSDGSGGVISLVDENSEQISTHSAELYSGERIGPDSKDGILLHEDRPTIITYSVASDEEAVRKVIWGVATHPFDDLLAIGESEQCCIITREEWWHQFFEMFYPPSSR